MAPLLLQMPAMRSRRWRVAELLAVWIKPGRHFNACYRLVTEDAPIRSAIASAFVLEPARATRVLAKAGAHGPGIQDPMDCAHCRSAVVRPGLLTQVFPDDYRLPTLSGCLDAGRVERAVNAPVALVDCAPSGYRPGMRCQIRYRGVDGWTMYGKVAVERAPGGVFDLHRRVHAAVGRGRCRLSVPQPMAYVPALHLTVVAGAPGESLYDTLGAAAAPRAEIAAAAQALGDLHQLDVDAGQRIHGPSDELDLVGGWVDLVSELYPELRSPLRAAAASLARAVPPPAPPRALVHRDFHDKQVLLSPSAVTVLDLDTACRGEPELDLGNCAAHFWLRGAQRRQAERYAGFEERFLRAYPRRIAADRVRWYRRSSALRLACVYALRPRWHYLSPALIAESLS